MTAMTALPQLRRNREFVLFQLGRTLSTAGSQLTQIAFPLLTLSITGSTVAAGVVGFARLAPYAVTGLYAGVIADRYDRRVLMLLTDVVRMVAIGTLAVLVIVGKGVLSAIVVAALVEGFGAVLFNAAQSGAIRAVVPKPQIPAAISVQSARMAAVRVVGPAAGGALFVVADWLPFVVDGASYLASLASILLMRVRFRPASRGADRAVGAEMREGWRYLMGNPFLRTCALLFGMGNLIFPAVQLILILQSRREGYSAFATGILLGVFAFFTLLGSLLSGRLRARLSIKQILHLEAWTWIGSAAFVVWPNIVVLLISLLPQALMLPVSDSVVIGYRVAMTPDALLGRVDSMARTIGLVTAPFGSLAAGYLLSQASARVAVAVFTVLGLVLALWNTTSRAIRQAPDLAELQT
jgi:MFS family permease